MKKYYKLFILPAIIVIIAGFFSGFSEQPCTQIAKDLLEERTQVLQKAYLGRLETDRAEAYLSKIETYPLLSEDVEQLRETEATDMDAVEAMEFLDIRQEDKLFHYVSLRADIRWHMRGPSSDYVSDNKYSVILKSSGASYKLSRFEPAEQK